MLTLCLTLTFCLGYPTPLSTPDTPNGSFLSLHSTSKNGTKEKGRNGSQIMVSVLNPLNPKKSDGGQQENDSQRQESGEISDHGLPTITLEVPSFNYGKCLSPIREMPSPLPTPCPSPCPTPSMVRQHSTNISFDSENNGYTSTNNPVSVQRSGSKRHFEIINICPNVTLFPFVINSHFHITMGHLFLFHYIRKQINKAKTVPQDVSIPNERYTKTQSGSVDSYSFDSGEGVCDHHEYCDGGTSDFSEISIPIPTFRSSSSSSTEISIRQSPTNFNSTNNIPVIMTSLYDSIENLCKPVQNQEPKPSARNKRLVKQRQIPPNIIIPQVSVSFEDDISPMTSNSSSSSSPVISPSGKIKKKPPPLVIPDSNFFNFKVDIQSAPVLSIKKKEERVFDLEEDQKELKSTSLDKNITLFKQKCFYDENVDDNESLNSISEYKHEEEDSTKETKDFLGNDFTYLYHVFDVNCFKGGKRVVKQNHVELQDYHLESSKTEKLLLASQSADQNVSNNLTEFQENIPIMSKSEQGVRGKSITVN